VPDDKLSDLQATVSYRTGLPYVHAVGMVGICTSAGNAAYLAAADPRVKALASVAGFLPGPDLYRSLNGEDGLAQRRGSGRRSPTPYEKTGEVVLVPPTAKTIRRRSTTDRRPARMTTTQQGARQRPRVWQRGAVMGLAELLEFEPVNQASARTTPTMVVHADGCAFPDKAKKLYAQLQREKELVWADGTHFDYYDAPPQADNAVANATRFFRT
jgi:uncharacterized protein